MIKWLIIFLLSILFLISSLVVIGNYSDDTPLIWPIIICFTLFNMIVAVFDIYEDRANAMFWLSLLTFIIALVNFNMAYDFFTSGFSSQDIECTRRCLFTHLLQLSSYLFGANGPVILATLFGSFILYCSFWLLKKYLLEKANLNKITR